MQKAAFDLSSNSKVSSVYQVLCRNSKTARRFLGRSFMKAASRSRSLCSEGGSW